MRLRRPRPGPVPARLRPAHLAHGLVAACCFALLSACQTAPTAPPTAAHEADCGPTPARVPDASQARVQDAPDAAPKLTLQGQLSLKLEAFGAQAAKGVSLGFFFNGHAGAGDLDLMTLLGSQVAALHWSPGVAELVDTQGAHRYASLDALSLAALGEALPLDTLIHWMQGRPDPQWPSRPMPAATGFEQLGWPIDTSELDARKLTATRAASADVRGARIKVYLDR